MTTSRSDYSNFPQIDVSINFANDVLIPADFSYGIFLHQQRAEEGLKSRQVNYVNISVTGMLL